MDHEPSKYCECKECLIIHQSFHNWRKLKQLETDIKNKAIARKTGSVAKTGTHLVTSALGIGGIAGKAIAYCAGAAVKTATESTLQDDKFKQKQKLYRQNSSKSKETKNTPKSFPRFVPILDEKETIDYKNSVVPEQYMVNRLHKFDNDTVIISLNSNVYGGWVEKRSNNLRQWRQRFLLVERTSTTTSSVKTYRDTLKIGSLEDMQALWTNNSSYKTHLTKLKISRSGINGLYRIDIKRNEASNSYTLTIEFDIGASLVIRSKSEAVMQFWRDVFAEIYYNIRYSGFELYERLCQLKKNQQVDVLWRRLAGYYAIRGDVDNTIRCYERAHDACPKDCENLIRFIEDLCNYFGDKRNDKQLELYQKMTDLYSYKHIDYANYCVLLYKMKKYEQLKTIMTNIEIMNHVNISIDKKLSYWNTIYDNESKHDNDTQDEYMRIAQLIKYKLNESDDMIDINDWPTSQLNNYAKMFINCGDYKEANNYLSLSIYKKPDDIETISLVNKNNQFLQMNDKIQNNEKDEIKQLKQSIQKLESNVEKVQSHSKRLENLELSVENLTKENNVLKNNIKALNDIVLKLQQLCVNKNS